MNSSDHSEGVLDGIRGLKIPNRIQRNKDQSKDAAVKKESIVELQVGDTFDIDMAAIEVEGQVRTEFDETKLLELAAQIEVEGQRSPIEVAKASAGKYLLITGERRYRALEINSAKFARATLIDMPNDMQKRITLQLTENLQRDDLTALELAGAFDQLRTLGLTQTDIAKMVGKNPSWVSRYLALIGLPDFLKVLLSEGHTSDTLLVDTLRKVNEIAPTVAVQLADKVKSGSATRQSVKEVYDKLKKQTDQNDDSGKKPAVDLAKIHYNRNHTTIKPDNFQAKVEARLANGNKVVGFLSTNRLVKANEKDDEAWCWLTLLDGSSVCVETSKVKLKSVSSTQSLS